MNVMYFETNLLIARVRVRVRVFSHSNLLFFFKRNYFLFYNFKRGPYGFKSKYVSIDSVLLEYNIDYCS